MAHIPESSIGAYVYAFNIAIQPLRLISSNVPVVLFPGLSHLSFDLGKQVRATLRAMRLLTLITVPVCIVQILLTPPLFRLILPPAWEEAVLPCQLLTIGLMFNAGCWPAVSLLNGARTVPRAIVCHNCGDCAVLDHGGYGALVASWIVSVAFVVGLFHMINGPFLHWVALRREAPAAASLLRWVLRWWQD